MKPIGMLGLAALGVASAVAATRPDPPRPTGPGEPQGSPVDEPIAAHARVRPVHRVLSPVTGRVAKIAAHVGQLVEKGDALATVEPPDLDMPATDLWKAEADFVAAQHTLRRMTELHSLSEITERDFDALVGEYRRAGAALERARRAASSGSLGQSYTLRSPVDGELIERAVDIGDIVQGQYAGGDERALFVIEEPAPDVAWVAAVDPTTGTSVVRCVFDDGGIASAGRP